VAPVVVSVAAALLTYWDTPTRPTVAIQGRLCIYSFVLAVAENQSRSRVLNRSVIGSNERREIAPVLFLCWCYGVSDLWPQLSRKLNPYAKLL
jgi:hypothetical protein